MPTSITRFAPVLAGLALLAVARPGLAETTLYDDMGGQAGVTALAGDMIDNALADDRIKMIFEDVNIPRLKGLIYEQFCMLTGGGCEYKRRSMHDTHAGLNLHEADFNALVEDLEAAMDRRSLPWSTQAKFLAILAPMERQMVKP
ncbi:MAG TPA: group 1 truncated hemoglobin [Aliidongia sp.]|uniref:group I truncated hemoglobin n=1 Tax=Aliidongia sp. TaxID=1914230 RepID=UPI002DDCCA5F|nr:group 1 truncated hemoglobin [Aliidongia sp.]HEV2673150.1 group 1 truncated hemoglobin [Aliidongia sp.]